MYSEIMQKKALKFTQRQTARYLGISRNTVKKYWNMDAGTFNNLLCSQGREKKLTRYDQIIIEWLTKYPDMSAAQVVDWLKEYYKVRDINDRTARRHISTLREEYEIKKLVNPRDYQALQLLPPGKQVQVDFGSKTVTRASSKKITLYFAAFILAHSKYLYASFLDRPFRTPDLILAFQRYFAYINGLPEEIAIDQDKLMVVSENSGDIIYTYEFERFIETNKLKMFVCRKSDPESKGIVESGAVRYIKNSFMPNRLFDELSNYQVQFESWLERTANKRIHNTIKIVPADVFLAIEKQCLRPAPIQEIKTCDYILTRNVHKDNTIWFKSNRYSVPLGTYNQTKLVEVKVDDENGMLFIHDLKTTSLIAKHKISVEKGKLIQNQNHLRDYSQKISELLETMVCELGETYRPFLEEIYRLKPRYVRDQFQVIRKLIQEHELRKVQKAIDYCIKNRITNVTDISDVIVFLNLNETDKGPNKNQVKLQPKALEEKILTVDTVKRDINLYCELAGENYEV